MKFRVTIFTGLLLFVIYSAPVTAQESDLLGIFFDEAGTQTSTNTTDPNQVVTFYLILQNPSHSEGIHSWECVVSTQIDGQAWLVDWELAGEATNGDQPPSFNVLLTTPLPQTGAVVLMSATAVIGDPDTEARHERHQWAKLLRERRIAEVSRGFSPTVA